LIETERGVVARAAEITVGSVMIKSTKYRERFSQSLSLDVPQNFLLYDQFVRGPFNSSPDLGTGQRLEPPLAGDMRFLDSEVRERVKNFLLGKPKDEEAIVFFKKAMP
jgi:hypothetical protein